MSSVRGGQEQIIITGFEKFSDYSQNTTEMYLETFNHDKVSKLILPVSYSKTQKAAGSIVSRRPGLVLSLGQKETERIELEQFALNIKSSFVSDNDGMKYFNKPIINGGPKLLETTFDTAGAFRKLNKKIPLFLSYNAGTYVCNCLYYSLLYERKKFAAKTKVIFIHIPSKNLARFKKHLDVLIRFCIGTIL